MCCILIAPMAGCAAPELADLCAYGRRVMPNWVHPRPAPDLPGRAIACRLCWWAHPGDLHRAGGAAARPLAHRTRRTVATLAGRPRLVS